MSVVRGGFDFGARFLPGEDGFAHAVHCTLSNGAGAPGTFVDDFEDAGGVLFVFDAAFTEGSDPSDEIFGHGRLAVDAADARRRAAGANPLQTAGVAFGRGKKFVPVIDGADVGIAGVGAALAGGVGDHDFGFFADVMVGFRERDGVAVGLGHFAAVQARDTGGFGEHDVWFG